MVEASGQESESSTGLSRTLSEDQQAYQSAKTESDVEVSGISTLQSIVVSNTKPPDPPSYHHRISPTNTCRLME
jgi:hypothetical protein